MRGNERKERKDKGRERKRERMEVQYQWKSTLKGYESEGTPHQQRIAPPQQLHHLFLNVLSTEDEKEEALWEWDDEDAPSELLHIHDDAVSMITSGNSVSNSISSCILNTWIMPLSP
jgi:hypothetical protein